MCHHCVMESVKERMLSRRDLFRGAAATAAAAAVASTAPSPLFAQEMPKKAEDLTHATTENFPTYFGEQQLFRTPKFTYAEHKFNLNEWRINEHTGTHMDAPLHFSENGLSVDAVPVSNLVCPLAVIDIRAKAAENPDAQVTPDDIKAWTSANGDLPQNACVAMMSGWDKHVGTDRFRNVGDDKKTMHFPGFHAEAVKMLLEDGKASGIAVDTLSLDHGPSPDFATHYAWLPAGKWGIEGVASLDKLPAKGATLVAAPWKIAGATGGPTRVIAMV